jgi:hypothetical protein
MWSRIRRQPRSDADPKGLTARRGSPRHPRFGGGGTSPKWSPSTGPDSKRELSRGKPSRAKNADQPPKTNSTDVKV